MELNSLREEINGIDSEIVRLFVKRTEISKKIGEIKKSTGIPVTDSKREDEIISRLTSLAPAEMKDDIITLYKTVFAISKKNQL